ncbi:MULTISPECIES: hypothetical protein [Mesorhizobium]|uniref:hypothetical protein n=2 Tax=Phyllobacteriaceae TaxID=69277 RepID=UPI0007A94242|nr:MULTISPECIES: hypothetical protein [Mesorhizobium]AMX93752.1 hypothetical protein A4R28_11870 [Mesorhizobium ciceri]MDF3208453.1 hypothetical protein [Mesorhizobium sp. LMG15046]MDF3228976.1 hypothetical protein [Mesorhizobium sp. DSM 30133]RUU22096.1 hypothetical protein EOC84_03015 [Mesorhizobium sp. Primo-B]RUU37994.1 hypothetical protein EOC83_17200 [Mesorhizobium sp. Primo-A]
MTEPRNLSAPEILFLKLETSGLYRKDISIDDSAQPWCPEIAAALCNRSGLITNHFAHMVKSDGRTIKENAEKVHGISARASSQVGIPEPRVLGALSDMLKTAPLDSHIKVVTFGDMDRMVVASLFARFALASGKKSDAYDRLWLNRPLIEFIDLQKPYAQQLCKLPSEFEGGLGDFKWPSLDEAGSIILGQPAHEGLRDAWSDLVTMKALYFRFAEMGLFEQDVAA